MIAPAKLNLFLHVAPPRPDGLHELFSLAVFTDFGDEVAITNASRLGLTIEGPFADDLSTNTSDNLAWLAALSLETWCANNNLDNNGAAICLTKNLPVASGIGGGSSDAASTLLELASHWKLSIGDDELHEIAISLGADVPVCLHQKPAWMTGVGDKVVAGPSIPNLPVVLVNPQMPLSTRDVYLEFDRLDSQGTEIISNNLPIEFPTLDSFFEFIRERNNDLEVAAKALEPSIDLVLHELDLSNAAITRMSGSGATCFGIYDEQDKAERSAKSIKSKHPDWWVNLTVLMS